MIVNPEPLRIEPPPARRPRRDRLYPATHWRARLSSFLRRVSERLNPLVTP
jgi:hypothetical protein